MTRVHVITNPASGSLISSRILPKVISSLSDSYLELEIVQHETKSEGDGHNVAREIVKSEQMDSHVENIDTALNLVILGGDGTTHELLDGLFNPKYGQPGTPQFEKNTGRACFYRVNLALVPIGTANAVYHSIYPPENRRAEAIFTFEAQQPDEEDDTWRFRSLKSMITSFSQASAPLPSHLSASQNQIPWTLSLTTHSHPRSNDLNAGVEVSTVTHLLTSHSLHASILKDSEALRASIPSIERFKVAAQQNSVRWTNGRVKLHGDPRRGVQKFDRGSRKFTRITNDVEHQKFGGEDKVEQLDLEGPFIYLICLSIDRLEPSFIPAPFSSTHQEAESSVSEDLTRPSDLLDILMIRPLRDPCLRKTLTKVGGSSGEKEPREAQLWDTNETLELRKKFAETRLGPITVGMYSGGKHVDLGYRKARETDEQPTDFDFEELEQEGEGDGIEVVEYYRCKGYEWDPVSRSERQSTLPHLHINTDSEIPTFHSCLCPCWNCSQHPQDSRALLTCIDGTVLESTKTSSAIMKESVGKVWIWK